MIMLAIGIDKRSWQLLVSSQLHLFDNEKARMLRALLGSFFAVKQVQQRPHARALGSVPPPQGQEGSRWHDKIL